MPGPYLAKNPGDIIRAQDWNDMQIRAAEALERHAHTGELDQGPRLGGEAIREDAELRVARLTATDSLAVGDQALRRGAGALETNGPLSVGGALAVKGPVTTEAAITTAGSALFFSGTDKQFDPKSDDAGNASIQNAKNYDALMILGRAGVSVQEWNNQAKRTVEIWDFLRVQGRLAVTEEIQAKQMRWSDSLLYNDQGGSIELGGRNDTPGTGTPYIDFHMKRSDGKAEDFNVRLINREDGVLDLQGRLRVSKQEPWQNLALANGWRNYGYEYAPGQYMKDSLGFVRLRGLVDGGKYASTVVATLPVGYRPQFAYLGSISQVGEGFGRVDVRQDGQILARGGGGWLSLDGIVFQAFS